MTTNSSKGEVEAAGWPRATYRFQFHRDFTLRQALERVPYLRMLGVSHLYASPLLKARRGSTHGYDVCDPTQLNPEIGTEADLEALVQTLRQHGMGLVLDIVPNHMGIGGPENPWWWDVLRHGRASPFADYFDIDWDSPDPALRGKVLVPVLGDEYERVLERGELKLAAENGQPVLCYFDHRFPIAPESLSTESASRKADLAPLSANHGALDALIRKQHYRLVFWRHGDSELNYRRFFTITTLAGVRVEDPEVFRGMHAKILDWHGRGWIDGLRIDHPDGLRDPEEYLERLRDAAPGAWITVEKILEPGEALPSEWPVAGTTGYDFLNRAGGLFVDPASEERLTDFYAEFTGEPTDCPAIVRDKKRRVLCESLVAEVNRLWKHFEPLVASHQVWNRFSTEQWRDALVELTACFPVYRTYIRAAEGKVSKMDTRRVEEAVAAARKERPDLGSAVEFLGDVLLLRKGAPASAEFVMRFQQLTGPAMAKGVEDTTFYCFNRFVALNEVGGDPARFGLSLADFHSSCEAAQRQWPGAMLASSTHDTKRTEDVRARLAVLSEIPDQWSSAVRRWSAMNEKHRCKGLPDRNAEYLFYQTMVGAWPLSVERALAYMEKASCEAKQHTNWTDRDATYDEALAEFVSRSLNDTAFTDDLRRFVEPIIEFGHINSLSQTLLKLTAPGIPDLYQGTELWDLSLVDPDNRRPVDFALREGFLSELDGLGIEEIWRRRGEGLPKLWLIQRTLAFRREHPELFAADSDYVPLTVTGGQAAHVCAFARTHGEREAVVIVPRWVHRLTGGGIRSLLGGSVWADTMVLFPAGDPERGYHHLFTGEIVMTSPGKSSRSLAVSSALAKFPAALLLRT